MVGPRTLLNSERGVAWQVLRENAMAGTVGLVQRWTDGR